MPSDDPSDEALTALEDYTVNMAEAAARLEYQTQFAQAALKNLHLVNGGAIIALLTFFGNSSARFDYRSIWWAFFWFGGGLTTSLMAYFGAYFSQVFYAEVAAKQAWESQSKARRQSTTFAWSGAFMRGNIALWIGIGCASASLVAFMVGAFVGLSGLS